MRHTISGLRNIVGWHTQHVFPSSSQNNVMHDEDTVMSSRDDLKWHFESSTYWSDNMFHIAKGQPSVACCSLTSALPLKHHIVAYSNSWAFLSNGMSVSGNCIWEASGLAVYIYSDGLRSLKECDRAWVVRVDVDSRLSAYPPIDRPTPGSYIP